MGSMPGYDGVERSKMQIREDAKYFAKPQNMSRPGIRLPLLRMMTDEAGVAPARIFFHPLRRDSGEKDAKYPPSQ